MLRIFPLLFALIISSTVARAWVSADGISAIRFCLSAKLLELVDLESKIPGLNHYGTCSRRAFYLCWPWGFLSEPENAAPLLNRAHVLAPVVDS